MGDYAAKYGLRSGLVECLGGPPESRSGSRDVVDQEQGTTVRPGTSRKAPPGQLEAVGSGATGLASEPVPSQRSGHRFFEPTGNHPGEQLGCRPRFLQSPPRVRRNGNHGIDRGSPTLARNPRREPFTKRPCEVVAAAVLEGQDGGPEYTVVLTPYHRCPLLQWIVKAAQTGHGRIFGRGAAA